MKATTVVLNPAPPSSAGVAAPVPDRQAEPQAAERADPLQRLPLQEHVQIRVHRTPRHRRGKSSQNHITLCLVNTG